MTAVHLCVMLVLAGFAVSRSHASQPVVLVDQYHFNALWLKPQPDWRMLNLRDELVEGGYTVQQTNSEITPADLADCAVFLITTPALHYTDAELAALQAFANAGGGVFFAANYGVLENGMPTVWATACQRIANALGYSLDNNWPEDNLHNSDDYPRWITFGASSIGSHPVSAGVGVLQSYSMTTLTGPPGAVVIASTDGDAVPPDRPALMAGSYGSGRVVVTGSPLYLADPVPDLVINGGRTGDMNGLTAADNRRFAYNAITWLAGSAGRPLVSLTSPAPDAIVYGSVDVVGTVCDAALTGYVVECAPASSPTTWTQIGPVHASSVVRGVLGSWDTTGFAPGDYLLRVTATNARGNSFSRSNPVQVKLLSELDRISETRSLPDGSLVKLTGKEVVAGTDDLVGRAYLEEADRSCGIGVLATGDSALRGEYATVVGLLDASGGEPMITALSVTSQPGPEDPIKPVGVTNKQTGLCAAGLWTTGMLAKVWGKVLQSNANGFVIDDGSLAGGLSILTGYALTSITPPEDGSIVAVTGIGASVGSVPALILRESSDVQPLD